MIQAAMRGYDQEDVSILNFKIWEFEISITVIDFVIFVFFFLNWIWFLLWLFFAQEFEGYNDYEDEQQEEGEGYEEEEGEEYVVEEPRKPTKEELDYLELRQKLKESIRKKMQKQNSTSLADSSGRKKQIQRDKWVLKPSFNHIDIVIL